MSNLIGTCIDCDRATCLHCPCGCGSYLCEDCVKERDRIVREVQEKFAAFGVIVEDVKIQGII